MLKLIFDNEGVLDLYVLHGESALDAFLGTMKEEVMAQIKMLKESGAYQKYADELNKKILDKAT